MSRSRKNVHKPSQRRNPTEGRSASVPRSSAASPERTQAAPSTQPKLTDPVTEQRPTVSVCTVTQNRGHLLPLLETCILNQTYPRELIQWVIVDDSDEEHPKFNPSAGTSLQTKMVRIDKKVPLGQKRNISHRFCEAEIIVYMDDDEYYPPRRIEHAVESLLGSGREVAGATNLPILFIPEREIWMAGPFNENHATANTFAFRRSLLEKTRYEDNVTLAEEKAFLLNYTIPMVQLDPKQTIVCFGHQTNTYDKRRLIMNGQNNKMQPLPSESVDAWIDRNTLELHIAAHNQTIRQAGKTTEAKRTEATITPPTEATTQAAPPMRTYAVAEGMKSLNIIIPSRSQAKQQTFLQQCIRSIEAQTIASQLDIRIIVCCDPGFRKDYIPATQLTLKTVEAPIPSQASALNAGIAEADSEYVAFLEDDDQWQPQFLEISMHAHRLLSNSHGRGGVISSTQLEINEAGSTVGINDYAIPSGWLLDKKTIESIGGFDCSYRFHLDNDWLGRAAQKRVARFHLVESSATEIPERQPRRSGLVKVLRNSADTCQLIRHHAKDPLIKRLVHNNSGTGRIQTDKLASLISHQENTRLIMNYGRIPW